MTATPTNSITLTITLTPTPEEYKILIVESNNKPLPNVKVILPDLGGEETTKEKGELILSPDIAEKVDSTKIVIVYDGKEYENTISIDQPTNTLVVKGVNLPEETITQKVQKTLEQTKKLLQKQQ